MNLRLDAGIVALLVCVGAGAAAADPGSVPPAVQAELDALRAKVERLEAEREEESLEALRRAAEAAVVGDSASAEETLAPKTFKGGERSLQALNPEISVVGDVFGQLLFQDNEIYSGSGRSGFVPRILGIHLQSNLDPFSFTKMASTLR